MDRPTAREEKAQRDRNRVWDVYWHHRHPNRMVFIPSESDDDLEEVSETHVHVRGKDRHVQVKRAWAIVDKVLGR